MRCSVVIIWARCSRQVMNSNIVVRGMGGTSMVKSRKCWTMVMSGCVSGAMVKSRGMSGTVMREWGGTMCWAMMPKGSGSMLREGSRTMLRAMM